MKILLQFSLAIQPAIQRLQFSNRFRNKRNNIYKSIINAVYINDDEYNYVEPDLLVVCDPDRLDQKGCHGAPDWLVEIVSPGSIKMDYSRKLFKYRTTDVREYWIVDPMKKVVKVHNFEQNVEVDYAFNDKIPVGIYTDFVIDFAAFDQSYWES